MGSGNVWQQYHNKSLAGLHACSHLEFGYSDFDLDRAKIVADRKVQLQQRFEAHEFQISNATSARIEITRDQLAAWDNSAR